MASDFLNFIFPEKHICFICEDYGTDIEHNLCSICSERLIFITENGCSICGRRSEELNEHLESKEVKHIRKCRECIVKPHYYTKSSAPLSYEGDIKQEIYNFKYNGKQHMYKLFGQLMLRSIVENDLEHVDIILPVPLHIDREKRRGFNQASLLARHISKQLDIELDTKNLIRTTHTKVQNKLDRSERRKNIEGVFDIKEKNIFMQKKILLIDDIYTTGSTVDECSRVLIDSGASEVFVSTLAVTPEKKNSLN